MMMTGEIFAQPLIIQKEKQKYDSLRISVKISNTAAACIRLFCLAKAAGVEHLTARPSAACGSEADFVTLCSSKYLPRTLSSK